MMGTGEAEGPRRALDAAEAAISNPLLDDVSLRGARAVLINITGGFDMTLFEVDEAANRVLEEAADRTLEGVDAAANVIFGSTFDESLDGRIRVSVVATGIDSPPDVVGFRSRNVVSGLSAQKSAKTKMFENIEISNKPVEQPAPQMNFDEIYQEDQAYESEANLAKKNDDERNTKRAQSFFTMFKNRASVKQQRSSSRVTAPSVKNETDKNSPDVAQMETEDDYDIPSCFRRKNK
jgi:cell division protein FtsZ